MISDRCVESLTIVRCLGWEWLADGKEFLRVRAACALPVSTVSKCGTQREAGMGPSSEREC